MNKYRKLASNTVLFAIGGFSSKLIALILVPLYSSYLTTAEFGVADIIVTTVNVLLPVLSLSLADAVLRLLYDKKYEQKELLRNAFTELYISTAILFIVLLLNHFLFEFVAGNYIVYGICLYVCYYTSSILNNYLKANDKVRAMTIAGIINTIITFLMAIVFIVILKQGLDGYLLSLIISSMIGIFILFWFCKLPVDCLYPRMNRSVMRDMLKFSVPIIPSTIAWWINTSADKYMITAMMSTGANGLYGMAHKIPSILTVVASFFCNAWQLSVIDNVHENDRRAFTTQIYEAYCFICFLVCSFGILFSKVAGLLFLRGEFFDGYLIMPMLFVATVFSSISGFLGSISIAEKNTTDLAKSTLVGAAVNISLNFVLIDVMGTNGAALATAISFMVISALRIRPQMKDNTIERSEINKSIIMSIALIVLAVVIAFFSQMLIPSGVLAIILTVALYRKLLLKALKMLPVFLRRR